MVGILPAHCLLLSVVGTESCCSFQTLVWTGLRELLTLPTESLIMKCWHLSLLSHWQGVQVCFYPLIHSYRKSLFSTYSRHKNKMGSSGIRLTTV